MADDTNKDPRKILEESLEEMRKLSKKHEVIESEIDDEQCKDGKLLGPRDDLEYQKMLKDIEESSEDE